jgi:hypothetical protein
MAHAETSEEKIARVCHEANRAYCSTIGDHSHATWDMAPPWQKDSAVAGVKAAIADPARTPAKSHEEWAEHKRKAGWKYGPEKRPEVLEHPCLVPYEELSTEQRIKDALFLAVVRTLAPAASTEKPATVLSELPPMPKRGDDTLEVGILTAEGEVVKDGEICVAVKQETAPEKVLENLPPTAFEFKAKKKRRG